jgi:hypothetical protein
MDNPFSPKVSEVATFINFQLIEAAIAATVQIKELGGIHRYALQATQNFPVETHDAIYGASRKLFSQTETSAADALSLALCQGLIVGLSLGDFALQRDIRQDTHQTFTSDLKHLERLCARPKDGSEAEYVEEQLRDCIDNFANGLPSAFGPELFDPFGYSIYPTFDDQLNGIYNSSLAYAAMHISQGLFQVGTRQSQPGAV